MPLLGLHLTVARELAGEVASPAIDADRGAFYLGATTPDIRVLTRWDREQTHFFSLNDFEEQDGLRLLFESQPQLREAALLNAPTAAFMAGYISHLVMDEDYICQVYRPVFGERSALRGDVTANLMDRLLQFELDRRDREEPTRIDEIRQALQETAVDVSIGFIARETLLDWRKISVDIINNPPTWDRFRRIASRHLAAAGIGDESLDAFMGGVPSMLQQTLEHVGADRIQAYLHGTRARARAAIEEYLS